MPNRPSMTRAIPLITVMPTTLDRAFPADMGVVLRESADCGDEPVCYSPFRTKRRIHTHRHSARSARIWQHLTNLIAIRESRRRSRPAHPHLDVDAGTDDRRETLGFGVQVFVGDREVGAERLDRDGVSPPTGATLTGLTLIGAAPPAGYQVAIDEDDARIAQRPPHGPLVCALGQ